ncbi:MAG TPA: hypothetical protein VH349_00695 [Ktedonobacterales bacterium]
MPTSTPSQALTPLEQGWLAGRGTFNSFFIHNGKPAQFGIAYYVAFPKNVSIEVERESDATGAHIHCPLLEVNTDDPESTYLVLGLLGPNNRRALIKVLNPYYIDVTLLETLEIDSPINGTGRFGDVGSTDQKIQLLKKNVGQGILTDVFIYKDRLFKDAAHPNGIVLPADPDAVAVVSFVLGRTAPNMEQYVGSTKNLTPVRMSNITLIDTSA